MGVPPHARLDMPAAPWRMGIDRRAGEGLAARSRRSWTGAASIAVTRAPRRAVNMNRCHRAGNGARCPDTPGSGSDLTRPLSNADRIRYGPHELQELANDSLRDGKKRQGIDPALPELFTI